MNTTPCPCVWGNWSEWSGCSITCEAGKSHRGRAIAKAAINDGKDCEGPASEEKICNQDVCCPVDCVWNTWEDWPACPSGCPIGGGLQKKTRTRSRQLKLSAMVKNVMGWIMRRSIAQGNKRSLS